MDPEEDSDSTAVYVQGLNDNVTLEDLADFFKQCGVVKVRGTSDSLVTEKGHPPPPLPSPFPCPLLTSFWSIMSRLWERPGSSVLGLSLHFWGAWAVAVIHGRPGAPFFCPGVPGMQNRVNLHWAVGTQDSGDIPLSLR